MGTEGRPSPYRSDAGGAMSIVYRIDKDRGVAFSVWQGDVTPADFLATLQAELADPDWPPRRRAQLVDLRTYTVLEDAAAVQAAIANAIGIYAEHRDKVARMRMAIVASDAFAQALSFQRLSLPGPLKVIVFNSLPTACAWLGLDMMEAERALEELRSSGREGPAA